ncbi:MAG: N-acetyltransferase [Clostridia bacterium]|nr:N-acetyltransferase [Clostridia bacterium]
MEELVIRQERAEDRREVENLVREAFWNVYMPGCSEHYVTHVLREHPDFVQELDTVLLLNGKIIGHNVFVKTALALPNGGTLPVLTMGPLAIAPEMQGKGYGKKLLDYCLNRAAELGYGAVMFEGNINFYKHCGVTFASDFCVKYHGVPDGEDCSFFLCKQLKEGYLSTAVGGVYQTPAAYFVDPAAVEAFDSTFPHKQKLKLPTQIF